MVAFKAARAQNGHNGHTLRGPFVGRNTAIGIGMKF
jgi:hypothetical protein